MSLTSAQPASQQPKPVASAEDEAAVRAIVLHWQQSWERFDAAVLQGDYADDADWLPLVSGSREAPGSSIL